MIEAGLSDFHMMTVTVMKTTYEKLKPRIVNYRDYKIFVMTHFDKFFWRNYPQKILIQTVVVLKNFYKIVLIH